MDEARHALAKMPEMAKLSPVEQAHSLYLMGRIVRVRRREAWHFQ